MNHKTFQVNDYLKKEIKCTCGRNHRADIEEVLIENQAIQKLPSILKKFSYHKVMLVADTNTWDVAGKYVEEILIEDCIEVIKHVFDDQHLVPNEKAVGSLIDSFLPSCDVIIAIGSGTINDLCKYVSFRLNCEYFFVATAPSMDGFASTGAALIINDLKTSYTTHSPQVIIADTKILAEAPRMMIAAGVADIIGKYTCLCDWKISQLINDEYYCPMIVDMVESSVKKVIDNIKGVENCNEQAIANVTEALIITGIAMSYVGNSRPASGSEHHLSHFWEMQFLFDHREAVLHGIKVGIGCTIITRLYYQLSKMKINWDVAISRMDDFNYNEWEKLIEQTYREAAPGVIALEKEAMKNDAKMHETRIQVIKEKWSSIQDHIQKTLPTERTICNILESIGGYTKPKQVGINQKTIADSIRVAKESRNRYTVLQLIWDLNVVEQMITIATEVE